MANEMAGACGLKKCRGTRGAACGAEGAARDIVVAPAPGVFLFGGG